MANAQSHRTPLRVVLDTNVVLSALMFGAGTLVALRHGWQEARFTPLTSKLTIAELIRVLAYPKFRLSAEAREDLLSDYQPYCTSIQVPDPAPHTPRCRGPFDVPFLELALAGSADFLVTGDDDLLSLAAEFRCPILRANQLLEVLRNG